MLHWLNSILQSYPFLCFIPFYSLFLLQFSLEKKKKQFLHLIPREKSLLDKLVIFE